MTNENIDYSRCKMELHPLINQGKIVIEIHIPRFPPENHIVYMLDDGTDEIFVADMEPDDLKQSVKMLHVWWNMLHKLKILGTET